SSPSSAPYSYLHSFPTRRSSDLIANGLLVLLCPDLAPIDIQPLRIDTLPGEVADQPPNSNLKLLLDERFRDLEFVIVFKPFQKLVTHLFLSVFLLVFLQVSSNLRFEFVQSLLIAQPLREFVIDFRNLLLFDRVDLQLVLNGPSGEFRFGIVRPVLNAARFLY